jgi:hypothetical protein
VFAVFAAGCPQQEADTVADAEVLAQSAAHMVAREQMALKLAVLARQMEAKQKRLLALQSAAEFEGAKSKYMLELQKERDTLAKEKSVLLQVGVGRFRQCAHQSFSQLYCFMLQVALLLMTAITAVQVISSLSHHCAIMCSSLRRCRKFKLWRLPTLRNASGWSSSTRRSLPGWKSGSRSCLRKRRQPNATTPSWYGNADGGAGLQASLRSCKHVVVLCDAADHCIISFCFL